MRICIVSQKVMRGDGQGRANYEIVHEGLRQGHRFTLLATTVADDLANHPQVQWVAIEVDRLPSILLRDLVFSWKSRRWLKQHRDELDVVQVYGCVTGFPSDVNTVQFLHSGWLSSPVHTARQRKDLLGLYQWLYTRLNAYWEKAALTQARHIVAVSNRVKQELLSIGMPTEKIQVIFNGVDVEEFQPGTESRHRWHLPEDVPLAMFAGDIRSNRKNLDAVLHAVKEVPTLHLVVVGSTEGSPYLQRAVDLGIDDRVIFLGYRLDMAEIMKAVDMFVFPSRYEPFGMVVSEAMATGLPVVTCEMTGASEILTDEAGIVLEASEDIAGLRIALQKLVDNPVQREQMGTQGRVIAQQHSWESKARQYIALFEMLASARASQEYSAPESVEKKQIQSV